MLTFRKVREEARRLVDGSLTSLGIGALEYSLSEPPHPDLGELTCNAAFAMAKVLGLTPRDAAIKIVEHINFKDAKYVLSANAHPAGYINFKVSMPDIAFETLTAALGDPEYGSLHYGEGKKVVVEHTSVNPNKALHIGHARNAVVGDVMARIFRKVGYKVEVLNYIDDTGLQVADVITGLLYASIPDKAPVGMKYDQYCGDVVYVKVNDMYGSRPELLDRRKEVSRALEEGNNETAKYAARIVEKVLRAQLETLSRLNVQYDLLNFESHILRAGYWSEAFETLKSQGVVKLVQEGKLKGCWVIESPEEGEEKVLVRSDGTAVYAAKDIPYAAWKLGLLKDRFGYEKFWVQAGGRLLWTTKVDAKKYRKGRDSPGFGGGDVCVTVIDARQSRVQEFVAYALEKMGLGKKSYHHLAYEVVVLSTETARELGMKVKDDREFLQMSGRFGIYVNVDDVLDALKGKAREQSASGNPAAQEAWLNFVSEALAVAALRYDLVKQDLDKIITFDLKESLKLEGDTGPYLVYSHARASRLLEKMGFKPVLFSMPLASKLTSPEEKQLVLTLSKFDEEVENAERALSPKKVAQYAHDLAVAFNQFYETSPVMAEKDSEVKKARAYAVLASKNAMRQALLLLGIEPLEAI
jgi:arginyl-tRNA synthetase